MHKYHTDAATLKRQPVLNSEGKTYDEVYNNFKWQVPEYFNIGNAVCDRFFPTYDYPYFPSHSLQQVLFDTNEILSGCHTRGVWSKAQNVFVRTSYHFYLIFFILQLYVR